MEEEVKKVEYFNKSRGIIIERIPDLSPAWFARRLKGLGGTDVGRVLGLNDWENGSCIEAFYEKIGIKEQFHESNNFTYWGRELEEKVANAWRYHDGTENGYIFNAENGKVQRECRNVNGFLSNEKYPHLYVNIDRMINKGQFKLINGGEILEDNGVLECKTASSWVAKKWIDGIDPQYIVQAQSQLICTGLDYAEIALLGLDTRKLEVFVVERNEKMVAQILEQTYQFWHKMVLPAKPLAQEYLLEVSRGNNEKANHISNEIQKFEPAADGSQRYKEFQNERWLSQASVVKAGEIEVKNAKELIILKQLLKKLAPEQLLRENRIREFLQENDTLDCGDYGKITWKSQGENGKTRVLRTESFKYKDEELVEGLFNDVTAKIETI